MYRHVRKLQILIRGDGLSRHLNKVLCFLDGVINLEEEGDV